MRLRAPRRPAIIHVPHSSRVIPEDIRDSLLLTDEELDQELLRMTDIFTNELFAIDPAWAVPIVFPVSRLVTDVERFRDDLQEPMAARGMGAVYTLTSGGTALRRQDALTREGLLERFYDPHHARLTSAVQSSLETAGSALIIDAHSFSSVPLPHEYDQSPDRPDICIGNDPDHTPAELVDLSLGLFERAGFKTSLNRPFAGALVPAEHYRRDHRVSSLMIELNRGLYLEERSGERSPTFLSLRQTLRPILAYFADWQPAS